MFRFRYANLLKYKADMEQQTKNELATATLALTRAKDELSRLQGEKLNYRRHQEQAIQEGVSASSFQFRDVNLSFYDTAITAAIADIKKAEDTVAICRQQLVDATQEKKKYEKLREKDRAAYEEAERKAEAELNDQIVTYRSSLVDEGETL